MEVDILGTIYKIVYRSIHLDKQLEDKQKCAIAVLGGKK